MTSYKTRLFISLLATLLLSKLNGHSQSYYTLDSCRAMALQYNKGLQEAEQNILGARYERKAARANYFPGIDASGTYMYNSRKLRLIGDDQIEAIGSGLQDIGKSLGELTSIIDKVDPSLEQLLGMLPTKLKDATTFDIHNVWVAMLSLKQPLFMGGKIVAYNKIARTAEDLATSMYSTAASDLIVKVDQAYWQVISLEYKKTMTESYVKLLQQLTYDIKEMYDAGVATKSDELNVAVKMNEAEVAYTKVSDGLTLSKMLLAQICGLPIEADYTLSDNKIENTQAYIPNIPSMEEIYAQRSEVQSLEHVVNIRKQEERVVRSDLLPNIAAVGSYSFMNPNLYNGFQRNMKGMFSVGVGVTIPILHWGKNINTLKVAKTVTETAQLKLQDAKEMIELQVRQAFFQAKEANKTLLLTTTNMAKAVENLQNAQYGFQAGVLTTQNVLDAQTAWLQAQSEKINAEIGVRLSEVYLSKAIGTIY
ncbi:MAG: TolC family protein [Marinifilaceae bacterium]